MTQITHGVNGRTSDCVISWRPRDVQERMCKVVITLTDSTPNSLPLNLA